MSKLDDILDEPMSFIEGTTGNADVRENMKRQIKDLIFELIGEDEEPHRTMGPGMPRFQQDLLRRELRKKVEEL